MADPLGTLWQLLAGTPAQASPTPGFGSITGPPSPGVTAPQTTPNTGGLLSSPLAQGALGAYFGYLARPRGINANRWQGLGMAGLGGLQGFEQAREQQLRAPLEQAKLQEALATIPKLKAETTAKDQETKMFSGMTPQQQMAAKYPGVAALESTQVQNQTVHDQLMTESQAPGVTPDVQSRLQAQAQFALKSGAPQDINKLREEAWTPAGLKAQKEQAGIQEQLKRTQQIGQPTPTLQDYYVPNGSGGYHLIRSANPPPNALDPSTYNKMIGGTSKATGPMTDQQIETAARAEANAAVAGWHKGWETETGFEERRAAAHDKAYKDALNRLRAGSNRTPTATAKGTTEQADVLTESAPSGSAPTGRTANGGQLREYRHPDGSLHFHPATM